MTLNEIVDSLSKPSWLSEPHKLLQHRGVYFLSERESKDLLKEARTVLDSGKVLEATNCLYLGLVLDEPRFLASIRKHGVLRISRYSYQHDPLVPVVSALCGPLLELSPTATQYLRSVLHLYAVAASLRKEYEQLTAWLAKEREAGLKTLVALVDFLSLKQVIGFHVSNKRAVTSRHPFFFSVEQLAEGLSSILALYGSEFGPLSGNAAIDEDAINQEKYVRFLISGAHLSVFREWELRVDRFAYRLVATETQGVFELEPPSYEYQRALELGFIHTSQQRAIKASDWLDKDGHSFHDFSKDTVKGMEEAGLITFEQDPVKRFRFHFPGDMLTELATVDEFFQEEKLALLGASRDLLTPVDLLLTFELDGGLTLHDLFRVSRLMQFIRSITAAKLIPEMASRPSVVFQSLIPVFARKMLIGLLGTVVGADKAEKAIEMMSTDVLGHVDIQYQPLIPAGDQILLPANIFANSNVYRNPLVVIRRRLYEDGRLDPLTKLIADVFKGKGLNPQTGVNYQWKGEHGEVDDLVLIDNILFAFECKNSLVPTGSHELMTSFDYVHTAADQLDRFGRHFHDPEFKAWLAKETNLQINGNTQLVTGIVMSNRMFMGWRIRGHAVRSAYELEHFIEEGTISMGEESHSYWMGDAFTAEDLRRFVEDDLTYTAQWNAMKPFTEAYRFDGCTVTVPRLYKDLLALADHYGFVNAKKGLLEQQARFDKAVTEFSLLKQPDEKPAEEGVANE